MAVRCSKCGEELLGPVNRCWKCGQQFTAQAESGGLPPVRFTPVDLPGDVVIAELAGGPVIATTPGEPVAGAESSSITGNAVAPPAPSSPATSGDPGPKPIRTGSP